MAEQLFRVRGSIEIVMYVRAEDADEALEKAQHGDYERYDEWDISVGDEALGEDE